MIFCKIFPDRLQWNHSSFKAFCSHYGDHYTATIGNRCWNEEATVGMRNDMTHAWIEAISDMDATLEEYRDAASETLDKIIRLTESEESSGDADFQSQQATMETLTGVMLCRKDNIMNGIDNAIEQFGDRLSKLQVDALASLRTAIISILMEETYHKANKELGMFIRSPWTQQAMLMFIEGPEVINAAKTSSVADSVHRIFSPIIGELVYQSLRQQ